MAETATLLHLLPLREYREASRSIAPDSLADTGFAHCSPDERTTLAVANALYSGYAEPMVALVFDPARIESPVRYEPPHPVPPPGVPSGTLFPHVYGPLPLDAVLEVRHARRDPDGRYVSLDIRGETARALELLPHPEGGWYRRTWTAGADCAPAGYSGRRPTATAVHFLLHPGEHSAWHTVRSDELWLWHRGGPLALSLGGTAASPPTRRDGVETVVLGPQLASGQRPQALVPGDTWQAATPMSDAEVLVTCVVSPGFDFADFQVASE